MASSRRTVISKVTLILPKCLDGAATRSPRSPPRPGCPPSTTHRLIWDWSATSPPGGFSNAPPTAATVSGSRCGGSRPVGSSWTCARRRLVLADLVQVFGAEARLGVVDYHHVAYLAQAPGGRLTRSTPAPTLPAHATALGKALLAFCCPRLCPRLSPAARPAEFRGTRAGATPAEGVARERSAGRPADIGITMAALLPTGQHPLMTFRIGHPTATAPHSPRRPADHVLLR